MLQFSKWPRKLKNVCIKIIGEMQIRIKETLCGQQRYAGQDQGMHEKEEETFSEMTTIPFPVLTIKQLCAAEEGSHVGREKGQPGVAGEGDSHSSGGRHFGWWGSHFQLRGLGCVM